VSVQEPWADTTDDGTGELLLAIAGWMSKQEKRRLSARNRATAERLQAGLARTGKLISVRSGKIFTHLGRPRVRISPATRARADSPRYTGRAVHVQADGLARHRRAHRGRAGRGHPRDHAGQNMRPRFRNQQRDRRVGARQECGLSGCPVDDQNRPILGAINVVREGRPPTRRLFESSYGSPRTTWQRSTSW
jgi:hypothetical protein